MANGAALSDWLSIGWMHVSAKEPCRWQTSVKLSLAHTLGVALRRHNPAKVIAQAPHNLHEAGSLACEERSGTVDEGTAEFNVRTIVFLAWAGC